MDMEKRENEKHQNWKLRVNPKSKKKTAKKKAVKKKTTKKRKK